MVRRASDGRPWYREPWPWILAAGPALAVIGGIVTAYLATSTEDGLVVEDYYRQGLAVNATIAREERARRLGVTAILQLAPRRDGVRVAVTQARGKPGRIRLTFAHPTRMGQDQSVLLRPGPAGDYDAALRPVETNAWHVLLEDETSGWRLTGTLPAHGERIEMRPPQEN